MKIILEFGKKNHFASYKYSDEEAIKQAAWVIRNFYSSIQDAYSIDAPRLIEAEKIVENLFKQVKKQTPKKLKHIAEKYCKL